MKIIIITAIASLTFSSTVFAASLNNNTFSPEGVKVYATPNETGATPKLLVALSKQVTAAINLDVASQSTTYSLATYHAKGSKAFGSAAEDTKMYSKDKGGTDWSAITLGAADSSAFTAWTSM